MQPRAVNACTMHQVGGAVMAHYNDVASRITASLWIEPVYEIDPNSDETLWEPWVDGFTRAMALRPDAWEALLDRADEETRSTVIFLMALHDIYTGNSKFTDDEIDEIDLEAPDLIPNCVATILHRSRPEHSSPAPANLGPAVPGWSATRPKRSLPLRIGPQVQAVLRSELSKHPAWAAVRRLGGVLGVASSTVIGPAPARRSCWAAGRERLPAKLGDRCRSASR
jgi:hypothetical protein